MHQLSCDIETFSSVDLSKCGVYKYAESPDFEILLFGYSVDGSPVKVVDLASGEQLPKDVLDMLTDPDTIKWAYNAVFERVCLSRWLGLPEGKYLPPEEWRCSMVWSAYLGLPMSLAGVGTVLKLEKQKLEEGKDLIKYFSVPCNPTKANGGRTRNLPCDAPEKWALYKSYNLRDVETEISIKEKLSRFPVPDFVWDEYHIDQEINDRGIRLDMPVVENAIRMDLRSKAELAGKMRTLTALENPNSVAQMKAWLAEHGTVIESLGKKEVAALLKDAEPELAEVLLLRQQLAKSSVKKYQAMQNCVCKDGRAHGMFMFYGANRTGRFSGRLVQLQNLPQNHMPDLEEARSLVRSGDYDTLHMLYDSVPDVLSELIRTAFIPYEGGKFIVSDFSAIEARVIAWLAGEEWRMELFRNGGDIYCQSASQMFKVPVEKHGINGHLRSHGKVAELACIAEDSPVLTDLGLIPIQDVTKDMLIWDGEHWVHHDGVVYRGEREVITYEGLTATPDHLVWVEGQSRPIQFGVAATSGAHLVQTGNVGKALRLGNNYKSGVQMDDKRGYDTGRGDCCGRASCEPAFDKRKARLYDIRNAGPHHRFTVSNRLVHNCGYGGSVGALKAMGAIEMGLQEEELKPLVDAWRGANPNIVKLWWDVDACVKETVVTKKPTETHGLRFTYESGFLFITLPSGRRLAYVKPRIGINKFGGDSITYEGIGATKKWERLESYGPKFVENCIAEGTPVLTRRGLVTIENVNKEDELWDGVEWVRHEGLINKGQQPVITLDGLRITPDHRILTKKGWISADESEGLEWEDVPLPDSLGTSGEHKKRKIAMAMSVHLWTKESHPCEISCCKESSKIMRMYEKTTDRAGNLHTWNVITSRMGSVAFYETAVYRTAASFLSQLRWSWNHGLSAMVKQFRTVLGRHGYDVSERFGIGPYRQQQGVLSRKLSLDNTKNQCSKPQEQPHHRYSLWKNDDSCVVRIDRDPGEHALISGNAQLANRISVCPTQSTEHVYDIRNCGPRHRFCVYDKQTDRLRIVSNCTQGIARDILCYAMKTLRCCRIVAHVHDELIIEADPRMSLEAICKQMGRTPPWADGLILRADGYETVFYKKD